MSGQDTQVTKRITRSVKASQQPGRKNLVGRPAKRFKYQCSQENIRPHVVKRRSLSTKETQTDFIRKITEDDLTNPDEPSGQYWEILAEKRQITLQEVLEKNQKLREIIDDLKKENALLKQMLSEANSFVEIVKEELASNSNNDTGIDVNDISSADDTTEEGNEVSSNDVN